MLPRFVPLSTSQVEEALALMRDFYAEEGLDYRQERTRRALEDLSGRGVFEFIQVENAFAGYFVLTICFSLEFGGRFALLDEFYVDAAHRGRGVGAHALEHIAQTAAAMGVAAVRLEVDRADPRVQGFYRRHGFQAHDRDLMTKWL